VRDIAQQELSERQAGRRWRLQQQGPRNGVWERGSLGETGTLDAQQLRLKLVRESKMQVGFFRMMSQVFQEFNAACLQAVHNRAVHFTEKPGMQVSTQHQNWPILPRKLPQLLFLLEQQESVIALKKFDPSWEPPAASPLYAEYVTEETLRTHLAQITHVESKTAVPLFRTECRSHRFH
jgi:hypothetical protein